MSVPGQVESAVPWWAVDYFIDDLAAGSAVVSAVELAAESVVDDPHFRLPMQPKVVDEWRGTGEAADPLIVVEGEEGEAGVARNSTENASDEGGKAAGGAGRGPGAVGEIEKKTWTSENSTEKK